MIKILWGIVLLPLLTGCVIARAGAENPPVNHPMPTVNSIFLRDIQPTPTDILSATYEPFADGLTPVPESDQAATEQSGPADLTQIETATPTPGAPATPPATPTPVILPTITVYDDTLNNNWTLSTSTGVKYYLQDRNAVHDGEFAIAMTPTRDYSNLAFTVKYGTKETYLREKTLGIRFWLYSGDATIGTQDLAVSVVGSNKYPYWVWNDSSVTNDNDPVFSETRLQYLGFNDAIPPDTWVQVEVWLDELLYDPEYKYVTGIYIKNGEDFRDTIWIDQVELVTTPDTQ